MKKRYANINELSEYTSLPTKTLYDWAAQGKIPSIKYGKRVLFDLEDIDQMLQSMKRNVSQQCNVIVNKIIGSIHDN